MCLESKIDNKRQSAHGTAKLEIESDFRSYSQSRLLRFGEEFARVRSKVGSEIVDLLFSVGVFSIEGIISTQFNIKIEFMFAGINMF